MESFSRMVLVQRSLLHCRRALGSRVTRNRGSRWTSPSFSSLTVNELGLHIKAGKIDATIIWDATAAYYADAAEVVPIPPEENVISTVPVAVLSFSKHKDLAEEFAEFVCSGEGRRIFQKHNYTTEEPGE